MIKRSESNCKLRCSMNEADVKAGDSVARQSVDIATDVTQLSVECKEQDVGKNKDMTGPADTLKVPAAVMPNFNKKIAANELVDKKIPVVQMDVPGVVQPMAVDTLGDIEVITPKTVSACVMEVSEAFKAPSG